jgi:hypothetical protein
VSIFIIKLPDNNSLYLYEYIEAEDGVQCGFGASGTGSGLPVKNVI